MQTIDQLASERAYLLEGRTILHYELQEVRRIQSDFAYNR
jgi:hypothetical protein